MLRATFYGFNIAFSGLMKSQKALDLTGNNIANVNTAGYTRQRLDLASFPSSSYVDRYAPFNNIAIGQGVNVTAVSQLRDPFLDARFRREASNIGELDAHLSSLKDISKIFDEVQFEALNQALQDFRSQLHVYSTQSGENMIDTTVWAAAESVVKMLNQYSNQIKEVREYQEFLMQKGSIPEVNKILENIALLNKNIRESDIYGNPALELRDQRNLLFDQLSAYMKIEVTYEKDPNPLLAEMGVEVCKVTFISDDKTLGSREAYSLVDGHKAITLGYAKDANGVSQIFKATDLDGNPVTDKTGQQLYLYSDPSQKPVLDTDGNHIADGLGNGLYYPTGDPAIDTNLAGIASEGLSFNAGALKGALEMLNSKGVFHQPEPNTLNGIGYYEAILDRVVADFAGMLNDANTYINPDYDEEAYASYWTNPANITAWENYYASLGLEFTTPEDVYRSGIAGSIDPMSIPTELAGAYPPPDQQYMYDRALFETNDGSAVMTAANIQIAAGWKNGSYTLTYSKKLELPGDHSGDPNNLLYMISLLDEKFSLTTDGIGNKDARQIYYGSFEEMFKSIGLTAAQDVKSKETALKAATNVIVGIEDMRNSLSSVSMDEEGVNLLRFQKSYAANARVMTTLDEALEVLINRLGIVGR